MIEFMPVKPYWLTNEEPEKREASAARQADNTPGSEAYLPPRPVWLLNANQEAALRSEQAELKARRPRTMSVQARLADVERRLRLAEEARRKTVKGSPMAASVTNAANTKRLEAVAANMSFADRYELLAYAAAELKRVGVA